MLVADLRDDPQSQLGNVLVNKREFFKISQNASREFLDQRKMSIFRNFDFLNRQLQIANVCHSQTCRLADLQTCRLADLQTCRLADLQTCGRTIVVRARPLISGPAPSIRWFTA